MKYTEKVKSKIKLTDEQQSIITSKIKQDEYVLAVGYALGSTEGHVLPVLQAEKKPLIAIKENGEVVMASAKGINYFVSMT